MQLLSQSEMIIRGEKRNFLMFDDWGMWKHNKWPGAVGGKLPKKETIKNNLSHHSRETKNEE